MGYVDPALGALLGHDDSPHWKGAYKRARKLVRDNPLVAVAVYREVGFRVCEEERDRKRLREVPSEAENVLADRRERAEKELAAVKGKKSPEAKAKRANLKREIELITERLEAVEAARLRAAEDK